jgi:hypothetical protein
VSTPLDVVRRILPRLDEAGIVYMVSGSVASSIYGTPRMTRDVDIVVDLTEFDVDRLLGAIGAGYYVDRAAILSAVRARDVFNLIHLESMIKLDFIVRKDSEYRRLELSRRRSVRVEGTQVWLVSPEDLVLSKLAWARDRRSEVQLDDVRDMIASIADLDWPYVERWALSLGVAELRREVRA